MSPCCFLPTHFFTWFRFPPTTRLLSLKTKDFADKRVCYVNLWSGALHSCRFPFGRGFAFLSLENHLFSRCDKKPIFFLLKAKNRLIELIDQKSINHTVDPGTYWLVKAAQTHGKRESTNGTSFTLHTHRTPSPGTLISDYGRRWP